MKNTAQFASGLAITIIATITINHDMNATLGLGTLVSLAALVLGTIVLASGIGGRK